MNEQSITKIAMEDAGPVRSGTTNNSGGGSSGSSSSSSSAGFQKEDVFTNISRPQPGAGDGQIKSLFNTAYLWAGIIAVAIIVASGIYYVTSAGSKDRVQTAKNTLLYAIVGLLIVIVAFGITNFVLGAL